MGAAAGGPTKATRSDSDDEHCLPRAWRPHAHTPTTTRLAKRRLARADSMSRKDEHVPLAALLAGLTGSGKTTIAQALADRGFLRLSVDEEVHRIHGRYGVDYPEHTYFEREQPVVKATRDRFIQEIEAGNDVVLDHGLWRRAERDAWRQAAHEAGGLPVVVYLPVERDELLRRLTGRNAREDANALTVTPRPLRRPGRQRGRDRLHRRPGQAGHSTLRSPAVGAYAPR